MLEFPVRKAFLRYHDPNNWPLLREALKSMGLPPRVTGSAKPGAGKPTVGKSGAGKTR